MFEVEFSLPDENDWYLMPFSPTTTFAEALKNTKLIFQNWNNNPIQIDFMPLGEDFDGHVISDGIILFKIRFIATISNERYEIWKINLCSQ